MRYLLLILLISCTTVKKKPLPGPSFELPAQERFHIEQAWMDGCMTSSILLLTSMGHKKEEINVIALTEICQEMTIRRLSGAKI
jgi:hypothetical protein